MSKKPINTGDERSKRALTRSFQLNGWNLVYLAAGVLVAAICFKFITPRRAVEPVRAEVADQPPAAGSLLTPMREWGRLELTPIMLPRPEECFANMPPAPDQIVWSFPRTDPKALTQLLSDSGLPPENTAEITNPARWQITRDSIEVYPSFELVKSIPPVAREKIYRALGQNAANTFYAHPFYSRGKTVRQWLDGVVLDDEKFRLIEQMVYPRETVLCFSDISVLQKELPVDELRRVLQAMSAVPTLLVKLQVSPNCDVGKILDYFGSVSRGPKVKPLLESLQRVPGGTEINVSWFFPPVPRLLMYSYPELTGHVGGRFRDCVWSCMNFFNETPDDRFLDPDYPGQILKRDYVKIPKPDRFGDLILLYNQQADTMVPVHMCVYVAEDIVFTKNGYDPRQPWVLMHMDDMASEFLVSPPQEMVVFRKKVR